MAQWVQTNEPYVKVHEIVKSNPLNPTVGEDLIIGVVVISDAGPSVPTLIRGQKEFLETYSSKDITQDYLESLKKLYTGADSEIPTTVWENVYRLAGSNTLLVCRASKANNIYFSKPMIKEDLNDYVLRDGLLLKKMPGSEKVFKFVLDIDEDNADHDQDGWSISVNGAGILGNRTTDDGPQYDYLINNLPDLIDQLNETSKFFSPSYKYYTDVKCENEIIIDADSDIMLRNSVRAVVFDEVYLGSYFLDTTDSRCPEGYQYILPCLVDWETTEDTQKIIDLNDKSWSGFEEVPYYATNQFNSATDLRVRIRRFNHDAVVTKQLSENDTNQLNANGQSPYTVLTSVLDTFTKKGTKEPTASVLERDFFEIAVWDPSVNDQVSFFNIGNVSGRGDIEVSELNSLISMIQLELPDDLHDLGLNYFGYGSDNYSWEPYELQETDTISGYVASVDDLWALNVIEGDIYGIGTEETATEFYKYTKNGEDQLFANLTVDPTKYDLLKVSDTDLKKALDQIILDEVYVTEGLCDGGNTELSYQNYMANYAVNENYFYAISTINSTNYMTIGNGIKKISQDSYKLYASAPWDIDTGTFGWKYYASPAVLYWEAVARNRRNNEEFRAVMGQVGGVVDYQRPVTEFNKKTRELLLSRRVNTIKWNIQTSAWNINDNVTCTSVDSIMKDEANSRLAIRIAKAMPRILWQFIGRQISEVTCTEMKSTIDYFFKTVILPMTYSCDSYQIFVPYDVNLSRQNKVNVVVNVRFFRTLKYVNVYDCLFDAGTDISNPGYDAWGTGALQ